MLEAELWGREAGEKARNIQIAKNMRKEGCSTELIHKVTGLSTEEIKIL